MKWVLGLAAITLAVAGVAGAAPADTTYSDPAADVFAIPAELAPLAPDLTTVAVSNTPDGKITFRVTIASPQALDPTTLFAIFLNVDKSLLTGDEGDEAVAYVDAAGELDFERWNGAEMIDVPETNMSASLTGGVLTYTVDRKELESTASFEFAVVGIIVRSNGLAGDVAPDEGYHVYDLVSLAPPKLSATAPTGTPAKPRAGKRFMVTSVVTRDDTGGLVASGTVSCAARIGKTSLRAVGRLVATGARCTMAVPKNASAKTLRGTMTVQAEGSSVKRAFKFRVT